MPVLEKVSRNKNIPVALIYGGANVLGEELVKLLIDQGAFVIVVDEYSKKNQKMIEPVAESEQFSFVEISGAESLIDSISRVDYIFYLNYRSVDPDQVISTTDFLKSSNRLDKLLQLGVEKKSKFLLASSLKLEQILQSRKEDSFDASHDLSYTVIETQRYAENLTWEYYKQGGLNARIVRMGEIIGKGINLEDDTLVNRYIKDAIKGEKLVVDGDGLENLYFVHVLDAAYGLVKAQFTSNTEGGLYALYIPRDITVLNLAYKIMDLEPRASGIEFVEKKGKSHLGVFDPGRNLKSVGWKPKISLERSLAQTIDYAYKIFGKVKPSDKVHKEVSKERLQGKKRAKKSIFTFIRDFFFEVKEEKMPDSVLDNIQYSSYSRKALGSGDVNKQENRVLLSGKESGREGEREDDKFKKLIKKRRLDLSSVFGRLKLSSFIFFVLISGIFLSFYIFLFAPVLRSLVLSKEIFDLTGEISVNLTEHDYKDAERGLDKAVLSLESLDKNLSRLNYVSSLGLYDGLDSYRKDMLNSKDIFEGSNSIVHVLAELQLFADNYQQNVTLEGSDNLTLTSSTPKYDFEGLKDVQKDYTFGLKMISAEIPLFSDASTSLPILGSRLSDFHNDITEVRQDIRSSGEILQAIPTLLGVEELQTYALILVNEEKLTPLGGVIEAVGVFDIENGGIKNVGVFSKDEFDLDLDNDQIALIKSQLGELYPKDGLGFENLTRILDDETFIALLNLSIERKYLSASDHVVLLNFKALEDIVSAGGSIELSGVGTLNASNYNQVVRGGEISYKELLAKTMLKLLAINDKSSQEQLLAIRQNFTESNMKLYSSENSLTNYFDETNMILQDQNSFDLVDLSFVSDSGAGPLAVEVDVESVMSDQDVESRYQYTFRNASEVNFDGYSILSFGSKFDILETSASGILDKNIDTLDERLLVKLYLSAQEEVTLTVSGKSEGVVLPNQSEYNYTVIFKKPLGFSYQEVFSLEFPQSLRLFSGGEGGQVDGNKILFQTELLEDELLKFSFTSV
ncbi:MAG: NAD-dependent epimerase/dehydratase family protein [Patescibacteria group bacterium]|nr:NAD-dependent epimerase/dehydratase family protein [Patescibacteria group bacterium]